MHGYLHQPVARTQYVGGAARDLVAQHHGHLGRRFTSLGGKLKLGGRLIETPATLGSLDPPDLVTLRLQRGHLVRGRRDVTMADMYVGVDRGLED